MEGLTPEIKAFVAAELSRGEALALRAVSSIWSNCDIFYNHPECSTMLLSTEAPGPITRRTRRHSLEERKILACLRILGSGCKMLRLQRVSIARIQDGFSYTLNVTELEVDKDQPREDVVQLCRRMPLLLKLVTGAVFLEARALVQPLEAIREAAVRISQACPLLESVRHPDGTQFSDGPSFGAPEGLPLRPKCGHTIFVDAFPNLTSLWLPPEGALEILAACPRVNKLYGLHTLVFKERSSDRLAWDLSVPTAGADILRIVRACTASLDALDLSGCQFKTACEVASVLFACPRLTQLFLFDVARLTDDDPPQDVYEWRWKAFSGSEWKEVTSAMPASVTSLSIGYDTLSDAAVQAICASGTHLALKRLELTQSIELSDEALDALATSRFTASLTYLDISCSSFDGDAIESLVNACPQLSKLKYFEQDDDQDDERSDMLHEIWEGGGHDSDDDESEEEGLKVRLSRLMESRGGSFEGDLFY